MYKKTNFKKKLISMAVASIVLTNVTGFAVAQDDEAVEEVIVHGIRAAIESSINAKRNANSIIDSITAEDIGKLPDATIADSLQRIPGIQIRRSAGEGGSVNIRGLPQVSTQLNGESYLGANSITNFQPNLGDIPSQLFKGADVIKSPTASLLNSGLSGTINLKTRRPFDFDNGISGAAAVDIGYGADSKETDPALNFLVNWRNDRFGFLISATTGTFNLANYREGKQYGTDLGADGLVQEGSIQGGYGDGTFLGDVDGTPNERFYAPEGWTVFNKFTERDRDGINLAFQADLGEGFELIAEYFYTKQDEWNRSTGFVSETKWANCCSFNDFAVTQSRDTGVNNINTYQAFDYISRRVQSYSEVNEFFSESKDLNIELNYDNGGPLTASVRIVQGDATQDNLNNYYQGDIADGGPTNTDTWSNPELGVRLPGQWVNPHPNGIPGLSQIHIDHSGEPVWSGFDSLPLVGGVQNAAGQHTNTIGSRTLADYISDPASYNAAAISSENNFNRIGELDVMRVDVSYAFDSSFITSVDVGFRVSEKFGQNDQWHGVSNFYAGAGGVTSDGTPNPDGCLARWKATDIHFQEDCQVGEFVDMDDDPSTEDTFIGWTAIGYVPQSDYDTIQVTDFGNVSGLPPIWTVDPRSLDNVEEFHTSFYGNFLKSVDPGASYQVRLTDTSSYIQANFEAGAFSGNFGVRYIETELFVKQNIVGGSRSYGMAPVDAGDNVTTTHFTDVLPAINVSYDVTEDIKLRAAYSSNMTPLNLNQWGDALVTNYALTDEGNQGINTVSFNGSPTLAPWRSDTFDISAEWYFAPGSMVSFGYFDMDIDSFPKSETTQEPWPDLDGTIRRTDVDVTRQVSGDGGSLSGIEMGIKYAFENLPIGFDANLTLSDAVDTGVTDIYGKHPGFTDNSETQYNLVIWYEDDRGIQARIAYNYRDKRVTGSRLSDGDNSLIQYQDAVGYLDASISYDIVDNWTVYLNASNITGEYERYYAQWEDQYTGQNVYEARYTIGVRTRF